MGIANHIVSVELELPLAVSEAATVSRNPIPSQDARFLRISRTKIQMSHRPPVIRVRTTSNAKLRIPYFFMLFLRRGARHLWADRQKAIRLSASTFEQYSRDCGRTF